MDAVNKTLYIPLFGKALVSRRGILLHDPKAEEIWAAEGFPLKGKAATKWLAFYMGMRAVVYDRWLAAKCADHPDAAVLHLGCGLDSRVLRLENCQNLWYDVDFPEVMQERAKHYSETGRYHMVSSDVRNPAWMDGISGETAIVVMEGISMYLAPEELRSLLSSLKARFPHLHLLMDCYTEFAARASRHRNPINEVGVNQVYGLDDPMDLETSGLEYLQEHDMTPKDLIFQLTGMERFLFQKLYAGNMSKKLYKMYEYQ